ncbi:uncharacterized protein LOC128956865 [Oppia nitens]|uniref:uncharacterized protein LOC128956865 n=1 Tax=Oppia nitens TaxID=1686743 RepID=UPI0023DB0CDB|nr:uncharacterized protein LOC128956865 [Oppia nitens]
MKLTDKQAIRALGSNIRYLCNKANCGTDYCQQLYISYINGKYIENADAKKCPAKNVPPTTHNATTKFEPMSTVRQMYDTAIWNNNKRFLKGLGANVKNLCQKAECGTDYCQRLYNNYIDGNYIDFKEVKDCDFQFKESHDQLLILWQPLEKLCKEARCTSFYCDGLKERFMNGNYIMASIEKICNYNIFENKNALPNSPDGQLRQLLQLVGGLLKSI